MNITLSTYLSNVVAYATNNFLLIVCSFAAIMKLSSKAGGVLVIAMLNSQVVILTSKVFLIWLKAIVMCHKER